MLLFGFFVFTAAVLILASIKMAGAILGNGVTLPSIGFLSPTHLVFLYPSLLFQVAFWTDKLNIITFVEGI